MRQDHDKAYPMQAAAYTYLTDADWTQRINELARIAGCCELCPRRCRVNRFEGERGFCAAPGELVVSSIFPHHGEEPPLSGTGGSGTVFFTHCTLKCVFCQNYQISHEQEGRPFTEAELAQKMLHLQDLGCHNINLVTPTHFLPWILRSLKIAAGGGLRLPIVYNCGGYELAATVDLLTDVVDIWLPDMKYGDNVPARALLGRTGLRGGQPGRHPPDVPPGRAAALRCGGDCRARAVHPAPRAAERSVRQPRGSRTS